ncbi:MAG: ferritin family protein [FCB group bacterium]|nr:ferritin family protein [FCB group bacterium]
MDIIKFAMKMELDGKAYYEKQAEATSNSELKKILLNLAEEEERHFQYFKSLIDNPTDNPSLAGFNDPDAKEKILNIFEELAGQTAPEPFGDDVIETWKNARLIEEKAVAFYKQQAAEQSVRARKDLLLLIAKEEYRHVLMIDGVLTWLRQPATFAESAQYKNFRSLEGR